MQQPALALLSTPTPSPATPHLRVGDGRYPLLAGAYSLGGLSADALPLPALERHPRAATLTVASDGECVLQRTTASVMVRLNGETLGISGVTLRDGATIDFGECRIVFEAGPPANGARPKSGGNAAITGAGRTDRSAPPPVSRAAPAVSGRGLERSTAELGDVSLVDVRTGLRHALPPRRMVIGREDSCDIVVLGNGVSRRHASITPVAGGFMLRDESSNGTLVNGTRVSGTYLLGHGDVVRFHDEEFRVESAVMGVDGGLASGDATAVLDLSRVTRCIAVVGQDRPVAPRSLMANLEIVRGPFTGACFQIERAVCSIGRGEENDVRIRDDTVSTTHATLLRKGSTWFVVDLRSVNGTYVDGSRVAGERELPPGARIRLGAVELLFRAFDAAVVPTPDEPEPRRKGFFAKLRAMLRAVAPPT